MRNNNNNNNNNRRNRNILLLRPCFLLCLALTAISFVLSEMAPTFLSRSVSNNQRIAASTFVTGITGKTNNKAAASPPLSSQSSSVVSDGSSLHPAVSLARELVQIESVTPNDNGCQPLIAARLNALGFHCEMLRYHDVTNLWAVRNADVVNDKVGTTARPLVVFAGHTDVVPSGPKDEWTHPPFSGTIETHTSLNTDNEIVLTEERLYGRGAADMKGGVAAFVTAVERFVEAHPDHQGSIGFLITSDEEGPAKHGTREVVKELKRRGTAIDMCIVGEPSSQYVLGDIIKVGRRGSLSGELIIKGIQGHIAYPHLARNPIHESLAALNEMVQRKWDDGNDNFQPTSFQISNIMGGTGATNVIPGSKTVHFNFRYSPETTDAALKEWVEGILSKHELDYDMRWGDTAYPYETTRDNALVQAALASVVEIMPGVEPRVCTSGGTSDGRFIAPMGAQVVELGPIYATIHKIDECCATADLEKLSRIYEVLLGRLLAS